MKCKQGDRVYFVTMVPSDKPAAEGRPSMKFVTVFGGVVQKIALVPGKKISVLVATVKVTHVPSGVRDVPDGGIPIQVARSELFTELSEAIQKAGVKYTEWRAEMQMVMEYQSERLDANAAHLATLNEGSIWGVSLR